MGPYTITYLTIFCFMCGAPVFAKPDLGSFSRFDDLAFEPKLFQSSEWKGDEELTFVGPKGERLQVRVDEVDDSTAAKLLKNKLVQLKMLYAPQAAAYPGMVTRDQSCPKSAEFPKQIERGKAGGSWRAEMPAGADFSYGICGSRPEPYWSQYLVLYCAKSKRLYDIRYYRLGTRETQKIGKAIARCL